MVAKPSNGITLGDVLKLHLHADSLVRDFWGPSDPEWSQLSKATREFALRLRAVREATSRMMDAAQRCPRRDGDG